MGGREATAEAHPNIALVKYWGKRPGPGNLPAVGSLSITLDTLTTRTAVARHRGATDRFMLDGAVASDAVAARLGAFVDRVRALAGAGDRVEVTTTNNFPTGAGLASSASGFAALAVAATAAFGVQLTGASLSGLARAGSGSAARSIFGGFVRMHRGSDGRSDDATATPLLPAAAWPLRVVVAITSRAAKAVGSGPGMARTAESAPFYPTWLAEQPADLAAAEVAVAARDFAALGAVAEHSCLKMHALALAARPPLIYFNGATLAGIQAVTALRQNGLATFFTVDAGPQIKAVCLPADAPAVATALAALPGVVEVRTCGLGDGARLVPAQGGAMTGSAVRSGAVPA